MQTASSELCRKIVYDGPSENVTQDVLNTIYEGKIPEKTEEA